MVKAFRLLPPTKSFGLGVSIGPRGPFGSFQGQKGHFKITKKSQFDSFSRLISHQQGLKNGKISKKKNYEEKQYPKISKIAIFDKIASLTRKKLCKIKTNGIRDLKSRLKESRSKMSPKFFSQNQGTNFDKGPKKSLWNAACRDSKSYKM